MTMVGSWPQSDLDAEEGWDIEHFAEVPWVSRSLSSATRQFTDDTPVEMGVARAQSCPSLSNFVFPDLPSWEGTSASSPELAAPEVQYA